MKKLLLTLTLLTSAGSLHGMESSFAPTSLKSFQSSPKASTDTVDGHGKAMADTVQKQSNFLADQPQCMPLISPETQPSPMTFAQIYYHFSHDALLPEIAQHIFLLQLGDSNLAKMEPSSQSPADLVEYIKTLIPSCGYLLASELCEWFFAHAKISICDIKDTNKNTSLHYAIGYNYPEVAQMLLKIAGDKASKLLTMQDTGGWTVLHYAAKNNNTKSVKFFLDTAADNTSTLLTKQTTDGWTVLHYAAYKNNTENVKLLLDAAGDNVQFLMDIRSKNDRTALDITTPKIKKFMQQYLQNNQ